jgi:H/ACA ribonucleoprotein complex subunit 3
MKHIFKCKSCHVYTINEKCPSCGEEAIKPVPPKYSPVDKYGGYRRRVKFSSLKKDGLL